MVEAIDVHSHHLPWQAFEKLGKKYQELRGEVRFEEGRNLISITVGQIRYSGVVDPGILRREDIIKAMDREGIDVRVISMTPFNLFYFLRGEAAQELCREVNDEIASLSERYPGRIVGMAIVPLQEPQLAVEELRRAVGELGLRGVEIGTNVNGANLDEERFRPFFQEVNRLGIPILIHPSAVAAADRLRNYYLINTIGNPLDTTIATASIILGGILDEMPNLRIILVHGGGYVPYQIGRIDHAYRIRSEAKGRASKPPSQYLKNFYFDTVTHNSEALGFLIRQVGVENVVVGSDYPFDMAIKDPVGVVKGLGLRGEDEDKVLSENAAKLFGL